MKETIGLPNDKMWLVLDNSSVHCSSKVRQYLKEKCLTWIYLPQYTPELAPVELFFCQLKRLMSKKRMATIINLDNESGKKILIETIVSISRLSIMKIWSHYLLILKGIVGGIDSILKSDL